MADNAITRKLADLDPPTLRTGHAPDLRIHVTQHHRGAYDARFGRWKAEAYRGGEYVQSEYGATELEALSLLVEVMTGVRR